MQNEQEALCELLMQQKKKYVKLNEVLDLTIQLAEAVDRSDAISASMLIAMRQEPMNSLAEIEKATKELLEHFTGVQAQRLQKLLRGRAECQPEPNEKAIDEQCQRNFRLLSKIVALDRPLNRKIGKDKAYYKQ